MPHFVKESFLLRLLLSFSICSVFFRPENFENKSFYTECLSILEVSLIYWGASMLDEYIFAVVVQLLSHVQLFTTP